MKIVRYFFGIKDVIFKFFVKGQKLRDNSVTIALKIIAQILFEEFYHFIPQNFPVIATYIAAVCS